MTDDKARGEFLGALNNEYFVLQGVTASSISESSSRSSLYLLSLSSTLVALGFVLGAAPDAFVAFALSVLSLVFVLGWFTVDRLIDTSIENIRALRAMVRIRRFFAGLSDEAPAFFVVTGDDASEATRMTAARSSSWSFIGTMASMIGAVNAAVGAGGVAIVLGAVGTPVPAVVGIALVIALALFALAIYVQFRRFETEFPRVATP